MNIITLSRTDIFYGEVNQKELNSKTEIGWGH